MKLSLLAHLQSTAEDPDPKELVHASMNFLAWGVFLPLGVMTARFGKLPVGAQVLQICPRAPLMDSPNLNVYLRSFFVTTLA